MLLKSSFCCKETGDFSFTFTPLAKTTENRVRREGGQNEKGCMVDRLGA